MSQEDIDSLDRSFLNGWYRVDVNELDARMRACADNGGVLVAELSQFAASRVERGAV